MHYLIFFIFLLAVSFPAKAADVPVFDRSDLSTINLGTSTIYFSQSDENHKEMIDSYIQSFSRFSQSVELTDRSTCKDIKIDVFLLENNIINDRDDMSFLDWESWGDKNIWGAYFRINSQNRRELFLNTSAPMDVFVESSFHELYHWYQDITCLGLSEAPAREFSKKLCGLHNQC